MITIGFCNGCFDDLHEGHKYFLEQASLQCSYLIVAVNSDASVRRLKGEHRPIHPVAERILALWAQCSSSIDAVIPFDGAVVSLITNIRPGLIIRGEDQLDEGSLIAPIVRIKRLSGLSTTEKELARNRSLS
jgi:rfaE bifunctional protein nucleotidyltransferase chain/domain